MNLRWQIFAKSQGEIPGTPISRTPIPILKLLPAPTPIRIPWSTGKVWLKALIVLGSLEKSLKNEVKSSSYNFCLVQNSRSLLRYAKEWFCVSQKSQHVTSDLVNNIFKNTNTYESLEMELWLWGPFFKMAIHQLILGQIQPQIPKPEKTRSTFFLSIQWEIIFQTSIFGFNLKKHGEFLGGGCIWISLLFTTGVFLDRLLGGNFKFGHRRVVWRKDFRGSKGPNLQNPFPMGDERLPSYMGIHNKPLCQDPY